LKASERHPVPVRVWKYRKELKAYVINKHR
jgi:hypothetical protein